MRVRQETPEFLKDDFKNPQLRRNLANGSLQPALAKAQYILGRLPGGSIVLDRFDHAWQVSREYWYRSYGDSSEVSSFELAQRAPIKVIYTAGGDDA